MDNTTVISAGIITTLLIAGASALLSVGEVILPNQELTTVVPLSEEQVFNEIDPITGVVIRSIVIDKATIDSGTWGDPSNWVQTSTKGTVRKNYGGIGWKYDKTREAFIPPQPYATATLNEITGLWDVPPKNGLPKLQPQ